MGIKVLSKYQTRIVDSVEEVNPAFEEMEQDDANFDLAIRILLSTPNPRIEKKESLPPKNCLRCDQKFWPAHKFNRICPRCKS